MARPANVTRLIFSGHLGQSEVFAFGWWLSGSAGTQASLDAAASAIVTLFGSYGGTQLRALLDANSGYDQVDLYSYNDAGASATYHSVAAISVGVGTSTGASLPLQCGWVVGTQTGLVSRSSRGRFYVPVNAYNLTDHQLTSGQVTSTLGGIQALMSQINSSSSVSGDAAVVSPKLGTIYPITRIVADSRLDIQRRRAGRETVVSRQSQNI